MEKLKEILNLHKKWLNGEKDGIRANLRGMDLSYANLSNTNLNYADLSNADLSNTNLNYADLNYADLSNADLNYTNLNYAYLRKANLRGANLNSSDLRGTDLNYADLSEANLRGADLSEANLRGANLINAKLRYTNLSYADLNGIILRGVNLNYAKLNGIKYGFLSIGLNLVCPEEGSYIGYKKARTKDREEVIIKLLITEDALRSSATTRKCRCSKAKVLTITSLDETKSYNKAYSSRDSSFVYRVGEIVEVDDFDTNRWNECSTGIHHFITRQEAAKY